MSEIIPPGHMALTIGPFGKWVGGLLVTLAMAVAVYWVRESEQRTDEVLAEIKRLSAASGVTSYAVTQLSDDVDRVEQAISSRDEKAYTWNDAMRDRERQAAIDQAQTALIERLQLQVDRIDQASRGGNRPALR